MMYVMKRRKPEATLLPTKWIAIQLNVMGQWLGFVPHVPKVTNPAL